MTWETSAQPEEMVHILGNPMLLMTMLLGTWLQIRPPPLLLLLLWPSGMLCSHLSWKHCCPPWYAFRLQEARPCQIQKASTSYKENTSAMSQHVHESIHNKEGPIQQVHNSSHSKEKQNEDHSEGDIQYSSNHVNFKKSHVGRNFLTEWQNSAAEREFDNADEYSNDNSKYS